MILADSIRQTASMARWVGEDVTTTHHTIFIPPVQDRGGHGLLLLANLMRKLF